MTEVWREFQATPEGVVTTLSDGKTITSMTVEAHLLLAILRHLESIEAKVELIEERGSFL